MVSLDSLKNMNNSVYWGFIVILMLGVLFLTQVGGMLAAASGFEGMGAFTNGYHGLAAPFGAARPASHNSARTDTGFPADLWYHRAQAGNPPLNYVDHGVDGFLTGPYPGPAFASYPQMSPYGLKHLQADMAALQGTGTMGNPQAGSGAGFALTHPMPPAEVSNNNNGFNGYSSMNAETAGQSASSRALGPDFINTTTENQLQNNLLGGN